MTKEFPAKGSVGNLLPPRGELIDDRAKARETLPFVTLQCVAMQKELSF